MWSLWICTGNGERQTPTSGALQTSLQVCMHGLSYYTSGDDWTSIVLKMHIIWSLPRCANAAPGPYWMPVFLHLYLQQPHLSHPGHGGEAVPDSGRSAVPTGSGLILQLSIPVRSCRCYMISPQTFTSSLSHFRNTVSVVQGFTTESGPFIILFVLSFLLLVQWYKIQPGDLDLYHGQCNNIFSFKPCSSCLFLSFKILDIRCKWEKLWHLATYQCRKIHT